MDPDYLESIFAFKIALFPSMVDQIYERGISGSCILSRRNSILGDVILGSFTRFLASPVANFSFIKSGASGNLEKPREDNALLTKFIFIHCNLLKLGNSEKLSQNGV